MQTGCSETPVLLENAIGKSRNCVALQAIVSLKQHQPVAGQVSGRDPFQLTQAATARRCQLISVLEENPFGQISDFKRHGNQNEPEFWISGFVIERPSC